MKRITREQARVLFNAYEVCHVYMQAKYKMKGGYSFDMSVKLTKLANNVIEKCEYYIKENGE